MKPNRMEPESGHCPEGYEYVHGYKENRRSYVRPFCRKIPKKRIKLKVDIRYPGKTTVSASMRQGWHGNSISETVPTEALFSGEDGKELEKLMDADWKDSTNIKFIPNKLDEKKRKLK